MKKFWLVSVLFLLGCGPKKVPVAPPPPPPPVPAPMPVAPPKPLKSVMPPASAELIENCVVTRQQNSNTVTCACIPEKTKIDSKTGKTEIVCKKMREER
jgi:hypothetical protein